MLIVINQIIVVASCLGLFLWLADRERRKEEKMLAEQENNAMVKMQIADTPVVNGAFKTAPAYSMGENNYGGKVA